MPWPTVVRPPTAMGDTYRSKKKNMYLKYPEEGQIFRYFLFLQLKVVFRPKKLNKK